MTIAIQLNPAFDIETYDGLLAYVTEYLELDAETVAQLPTLLRKGEYRLNRMITAPERETSASLTTVAGSNAVTLPADYRQLRNARVLSASGRPLDQVPLDTVHDLFAGLTGEPKVYAISEEALQVGPTPDDAYTIRIVYKAVLPALSAANQTNWLSLSNADAYAFALLWQTAAWLEDFDAAEKFRAELFAIIEEINLDGSRYRNGAPLVPRVCDVP